MATSTARPRNGNCLGTTQPGLLTAHEQPNQIVFGRAAGAHAPRAAERGGGPDRQKRCAPGGGFGCHCSERKRTAPRSGLAGADHCAAMTTAAIPSASALRRRRKKIAAARTAK